MATLATTAERWLADEWEKIYNSAVLSGIVGDLAHKARGGYHISRQDQPSNNYSVVRADDKPGMGPNDRAAAIDMTMNTADIVKCHTRLRAVWQNRSKDPRMKYINAWNGWDGNGDAGRYDVITGNVTTATPDHKWHIHLEIRRRYVNDMVAMKAILSMLKGESLATYQASIAAPRPAPAPTPAPRPVANPAPQEEEMTQEEFTKLLLNAINDPMVSTQLRARPWQYAGGGLAGATSTLNSLATIYSKVHAIADTLSAIATRVDLDPAEIEALRQSLAIPTAQQNADAVLQSLGGMNAAELANILRNVLGTEKITALKAVL